MEEETIIPEAVEEVAEVSEVATEETPTAE